jgi:hypothetical protein
MVQVSLTEPRDGELLEHEMRQSLAVRSHKAELDHVTPGGRSLRLAVLYVDGRTRTLQGAGPELAGLARGLGADIGAPTEVLFWGARPCGPARLLRRPITRSTGGGGSPGDGPGTAGVREPRRPYPPGFPPMQASQDPPVG